MAKEKANVEDTVKDIIDIGIDFRPRLISSQKVNSTFYHIVKPTNFDGEYLTITSAAAGSIALLTELISVVITTAKYTFAHHLDREPVAYRVVYQNKAGCIYDEGTTWTKKQIYLISDTADVTCRVIIY